MNYTFFVTYVLHHIAVEFLNVHMHVCRKRCGSQNRGMHCWRWMYCYARTVVHPTGCSELVSNCSRCESVHCASTTNHCGRPRYHGPGTVRPDTARTGTLHGPTMTPDMQHSEFAVRGIRLFVVACISSVCCHPGHCQWILMYKHTHVLAINL